MPMRTQRRLARLRRRGIPTAWLALFIVLALIWGFFRFLSAQLRPILETMAVSQATNLMSRTLATAVDECLAANSMNYTDFVTMETDQNGQVTSLTGNTTQTSRFRRQVVDASVQALEQLKQADLGIPIGNLTGHVLFSGLGPTVTVKVYSVGDISADLTNTFEAAGVNQTLHRICLELTATIYLFIPGEIIPVVAETSVCVAETVIVGEVPSTYLQLEKGVYGDGS